MQHCHHQCITQDYTCIVLQLNYICTYIKNYVLLKNTYFEQLHHHFMQWACTQHVHTHMNTHTHTHTHTCAHMHAHAHTQTHKYKHTHIHNVKQYSYVHRSFTFFTHGSHKTYRSYLQGCCTVYICLLAVYIRMYICSM